MIQSFEGMEQVDQALRMGEEIFTSTINGTYKSYDINQFYSIFKNEELKMNEYGLVDLCLGIPTNREARVDLWYKPSYALIAMYVYMKNHYPSSVDTELRDKFSALMELSFEYGIVGHGFDRNKMIYDTMLMLGRAGAKEFIKREPEFSPNFTNVMEQTINSLEEFYGKVQVEEKEYFSWEPSLNEFRLVLNAWNGNGNAVFVYGTLMAKERAANMLQGFEYCGDFLLQDYAMYQVAEYPGIKACKGESTVGEVYFVNDECMKQMDHYEVEGTLYTRKVVTVKNPYGNIQANAYVYLKPVTTSAIRNKWNAKEDDYVWYAGYGSNLSADRFKLYITGGFYDVTGKTYEGCRNKDLWLESECRTFSGEMYFGNKSGSWYGDGVSFYDPDGDWTTIMKMYKITWGQLLDVQRQEGMSANWYGRRVCLGIHEDGCPIYTFTSEERRPANKPHEKYVDVMREALVQECGCTEKKAKGYLKAVINRK